MSLTPELVTAAIVGLIAGLAAVGNYLAGRRNAHKLDPVTAGIAGGFVDHDLMHQLVEHQRRTADEVKRAADALERLADKKQDEMRETLEEIADELKRPRPRR